MSDSPQVETPDLSLLSRLVNGAIRRHCQRYNCSPSEREDLAQDGMIAALAASCSYDPSQAASYSTWITRRVQGQLIDSTRKLRSHGITNLPAKLTSAPIVSHVPNGNNGPEALLDSADCEDCLSPKPEDVADLERGLQLLDSCLPPGDIELIRLRYGFDGEVPLTEPELAARYDCSQQAINQRLSRVLRRARGCLSQTSPLFH